VREYGSEGEAAARERDLMALQPIANPEVMLGLTAMCIVRGLTGFMTFMLAFGLRRMHGVGLYWYGLVLAGTGAGAIVGLVLVGRLRKRMSEQQLLLSSLWLIAVTAGGCAVWGTLLAQVVMAFFVGLCGAVAQPSFDSMTQRYIPLSAQGRAFARFGMRQQLVWVVGSLIPVIIAFSLPQGDATMAVLAALGGLSYVSGRRAAHAPRVVGNVRDLGNRPRGPNRNVRDVGEFGGSAGG
jgi:MFS family permease